MAALATDARAGAVGHGECRGSVESELVEVCKLRFFGEEEAVVCAWEGVDGEAEACTLAEQDMDNYYYMVNGRIEIRISQSVCFERCPEKSETKGIKQKKRIQDTARHKKKFIVTRHVHVGEEESSRSCQGRMTD